MYNLYKGRAPLSYIEVLVYRLWSSSCVYAFASEQSIEGKRFVWVRDKSTGRCTERYVCKTCACKDTPSF